MSTILFNSISFLLIKQQQQQQKLFGEKKVKKKTNFWKVNESYLGVKNDIIIYI